MKWTRDTIVEGLKQDYYEAMVLLLTKGWGRDGALVGAQLQGWDTVLPMLEDSVLDDADFTDANLEGLSLIGGSAHRTRLVRADLRKCLIFSASLCGAVLDGAQLQQAAVSVCDLRGASLVGADLRHASLTDLNLCGATLRDAKLQGAKLNDISADETTILPDGSHWSAAIEWGVYTGR